MSASKDQLGLTFRTRTTQFDLILSLHKFNELAFRWEALSNIYTNLMSRQILLSKEKFPLLGNQL